MRYSKKYSLKNLLLEGQDQAANQAFADESISGIGRRVVDIANAGIRSLSEEAAGAVIELGGDKSLEKDIADYNPYIRFRIGVGLSRDDESKLIKYILNQT